MKLAIIGTGISGLSLAQMLKKEHEVVLFEKEDKLGGMLRCDRVESILFHKVGGHVFNSKNQAVLDWFWSYFDKEKEFIQANRNAKIFFDGQIIGYPIENFIYSMSKEVGEQVITEIIDLQKNTPKDPFSYSNFEDFLKGNFGVTLYELYFKPYNQKIWNIDLSKIAMNWLSGKLPMPNFSEIILSNIFREQEGEMVHSSFYYPKNNGSQYLVDRLSQSLDIRLSSCVSGWCRDENGKYEILEESGFDRIIYTGDVRKLPRVANDLLLKNSSINLEYIHNLPSNGTSNLLCEVDSNDLSWLYIPQQSLIPHRIIYTGNFSTTNNGESTRKTCVVEFSGKVDYETMKRESAKLPGNIKPIAFNYEPCSYVIQDLITRDQIKLVKEELSKEGIFLLGRLAEWEYYNMDKCIESAMELVGLINSQNENN